MADIAVERQSGSIAAFSNQTREQISMYAAQFHRAANASPELAAEILVNAVNELSLSEGFGNIAPTLTRLTYLFGMVAAGEDSPRTPGRSFDNESKAIQLACISLGLSC